MGSTQMGTCSPCCLEMVCNVVGAQHFMWLTGTRFFNYTFRVLAPCCHSSLLASIYGIPTSQGPCDDLCPPIHAIRDPPASHNPQHPSGSCIDEDGKPMQASCSTRPQRHG